MQMQAGGAGRSWAELGGARTLIIEARQAPPHLDVLAASTHFTTSAWDGTTCKGRVTVGCRTRLPPERPASNRLLLLAERLIVGCAAPLQCRILAGLAEHGGGPRARSPALQRSRQSWTTTYPVACLYILAVRWIVCCCVHCCAAVCLAWGTCRTRVVFFLLCELCGGLDAAL
jgi:hypothetical protein